LRARFADRFGVNVARTESEDDLRQRVRRALADGVRTVVAAGGDGTVHAVANVLADEGASEVALGIVPIGTGNDTARTLGVPLDPEEAAALLLDGRSRRRTIDLLEADRDGGRVFAINTITGGNAARVVEETDSEAKSKWGPLAYFGSAVSVLRRQKVYRGRLWIDDEPERKLKIINLHFGNGRTSSGGFPSAPDADPADGRVDVIALSPASWPRLMGAAARHLVGRSQRDPQLFERQVAQARFELHPEPDWRVDGESSPPVRAVRVRGGALTVHAGPA